MSKDDEALVRTTLSPKAKRGRECWQLTKTEKRRRPIRRKLADQTEAKCIRLVAVHYPVRPGNGLRSIRPVRIRVLSVAQLVDAGAAPENGHKRPNPPRDRNRRRSHTDRRRNNRL